MLLAIRNEDLVSKSWAWSPSGEQDVKWLKRGKTDIVRVEDHDDEISWAQ